MKKLVMAAALLATCYAGAYADDIKDRIIGHDKAKTSYFAKAKKALDEHNYGAAREAFAYVILAGAEKNSKEFFEAADYINIGDKDKLFKIMFADYEKSVDAEISALQILLEAANKLPEGSTERTDLESKINDLAKKIAEKKKEVETETAKRTAEN